MQIILRIVGVILILLAVVKVFGMIAIVVNGSSDHATSWFVKQSIYAVAFASLGWRLLARSKT